MLFSIDLFGSCHNLLIKTPLIDYNQIELFRYKELKGYFFNANNKSRKIDTYDKLNNSFNSNLNDFDNFEDIKKITDLNSHQTQLHKEMFWEPNSNTRLISFETDFIDFNYMKVGSVSEPYILKVHNNSNEDMRVKFIFEKPINLNNLIQTINIFHSEDTVFFTQPEEQIIPKNSSADFKVYFKPNQKEFYFYLNLPCQATILSSNSNYSFNSTLPLTQRNKLININKNKLSDFGKIMANKNIKMKATLFNTKSTLLSSFYANKTESKNFEGTLSPRGFTKSNFHTKSNSNHIKQFHEPPITLFISLVGHSFPPGTQIFMSMYELTKKGNVFPTY